jgi:hypothetical protein
VLINLILQCCKLLDVSLLAVFTPGKLETPPY